MVKNARSSLAKGTLSFCGWADEVLTGKVVTGTLGKANVGTIVGVQSSLDLLKDDFTLGAFCSKNLLRLWETSTTGGYFMLPFVSLRLAVMTEALAAETRLGLLSVTFYMFFKMMEEYSCTGVEGGIDEINKRAGVRKTLWTKEVCCLGANLCVALAWLIRDYAALGIQFLALNRIGTHPVECLFGTTCSVLRGDTWWERFLSAQVDAVMIGEIQEQLCLRPYIRRQNTVAGIIVCLSDVILVEADCRLTPLLAVLTTLQICCWACHRRKVTGWIISESDSKG
jgi:hypothetical protein